MNSCVLGFNGERLDRISGTTHLGNGYRAYNPILMRFNSPDCWSPFGNGGINPYVYCAGDPVNQADPSGHLSWQAWLGIGMGIAGIGLAIFTGGASIAAAGGVMAAYESSSAVSLLLGAFSVVSDVTAIASGASEEQSPRTSAIVGWLSLATGAAGLAHGIYSVGRAGYPVLNKLASAFSKGLSPGDNEVVRAAKVMKTAGMSDVSGSATPDFVVGGRTGTGAIIADYFTAEDRAMLDKYGQTGGYSEVLYRGDTRPPEEIFKHGFSARGKNLDILAHVNGNMNSRFVSFSKSKLVAAFFAHFKASGDTTYLYKINRLDYAIDITSVSRGYGYENIQEVIAIDSVPGSHISGVNILRSRKVDPKNPEGWVMMGDRIEFRFNPDYISG